MHVGHNGGRQLCPEEAPDDDFFDCCVVNHSLLGVRTALELQRPFAVFNGFRRPHIRGACPRGSGTCTATTCRWRSTR